MDLRVRHLGTAPFDGIWVRLADLDLAPMPRISVAQHLNRAIAAHASAFNDFNSERRSWLKADSKRKCADTLAD